MPKVTVDGAELDVPEGATVLQACELSENEFLHIHRQGQMCLFGGHRSDMIVPARSIVSAPSWSFIPASARYAMKAAA